MSADYSETPKSECGMGSCMAGLEVGAELGVHPPLHRFLSLALFLSSLSVTHSLAVEHNLGGPEAASSQRGSFHRVLRSFVVRFVSDPLALWHHQPIKLHAEEADETFALIFYVVNDLQPFVPLFLDKFRFYLSS